MASSGEFEKTLEHIWLPLQRRPTPVWEAALYAVRLVFAVALTPLLFLVFGIYWAGAVVLWLAVAVVVLWLGYVFLMAFLKFAA